MTFGDLGVPWTTKVPKRTPRPLALGHDPALPSALFRRQMAIKRLPQPLRQPARVAGCESLPVVVEVGEHLDLRPPRCDSPPPLLQLARGVVTATAAVSAMEADVGPVRGQLVRLEGALGVVADHERGVM